MGLDMYLYKREYVSGWNYRKDADTSLYDTIIEKLGVSKCDASPHANVEVCIAYWRKANAVHAWFVNLAGGVDECQPIYVTRDHLVELRDLCASVIKQPAMAGDVMPTQGGFFFGSLDYDEWYMDDMKNTVDQLDKILADNPEDSWASFIYQASW